MKRLGPMLMVLSMLFALAASGCASAPPRARDPDTLTMNGALVNRFVRAGAAGQMIARLTIATRAQERGKRPPVNVALVVDTSGSMEGRAIEDARAASAALIDALAPPDRVAVVVFHSQTELLLRSTKLEDARIGDVKRRLATMKAQGTTDLAKGLQMGIDEVAAHLDPEGINRVILLGDGVPNDEAPIRAIAQAAGSKGISITAMGLGPDYNETVMGAIAQLSGGRFHYVADSASVVAFFKEEVVRLTRVYAKNAVLELSPGPGVTIEGAVGQASSRAGSTLRVPIGDVSLGDTRDVIVRLNLGGHRAGANVELMDAVLRFSDGLGAESSERRVFLGARATADEGELKSGRNEEVERAAASAQTAALTLNAIDAARQGQLERANEQLDRAAESAVLASPPEGPRQPSHVRPAKRIEALRKALPSASPMPASPGGSAPKPASPGSAHTLRKAHDEAIRVLQAH